jgi:hypothetical protein
MGKTAYLVVWLDTARLKIMKIGIYSEPHPTPNKERWQPATLAEAQATDYKTAVGMLCEHIADNVARPGLRDIGWVFPFLRDDLQARVRGVGCPHCRQPLVREPEPAAFCSACGKEVFIGARGCHYCGEAFEGNVGPLTRGPAERKLKGQVGQ